MGEKNGNGNGHDKRRAFKKDENIQAWKLCAKSAIRLDELRAQLKQEQERFEKLKDALRNGGYLVDEQGHLPLDENEEPEGDGARA